MRFSPKAVRLIKHFEGCRLRAYLDSANVPTIGYGRTKRVFLGMQITEEEAEDYLLEDMEEHEFELNRMLKVPIYQNQHDALLSLVFNIGAPKIEKSTLIRMINEGNDQASKQFLKWDKAKNPRTGLLEPLPGLVKRRQVEKELYDTGELILL